MVAYVFGNWIDVILSLDVFSYQLGYFCCCSLFLGGWGGDLSPVPRILLCLQAVINNRHVSPALTPPLLPHLCDTGHIIILTSNKNTSAISPLKEFLLLSVSHSPVVTYTECTKWQKKIHQRAGVIVCPKRNMWGCTLSWLTPQSWSRQFSWWKRLAV